MPIKIIPRRSVTIEAWDATNDDLLRVRMSDRDRTTHYLRANAPGYGKKPMFWFDLEFMPNDLKKAALEKVKFDAEWNSRQLDGLSVGEVTYHPSDEEVYDILKSDHRRYYIQELDYDLSITVDIRYAGNQYHQWHDYNTVTHIEWITREQARTEVSRPSSP